MILNKYFEMGNEIEAASQNIILGVTKKTSLFLI